MNISLDILNMRAIITTISIPTVLTVTFVTIQLAAATFGIPAPSALTIPVIIAFIVCPFCSLLPASSELAIKRNTLSHKAWLYVNPLQR